MLLLLTYSDGTKAIKEFSSQEEADWYCHNEGDHLVLIEKGIKYGCTTKEITKDSQANES